MKSVEEPFGDKKQYVKDVWREIMCKMQTPLTLTTSLSVSFHALSRSNNCRGAEISLFYQRSYSALCLIHPLVTSLSSDLWPEPVSGEMTTKESKSPLSLQSIYHLLNFKLANMTRSHRRQRACVLLGGEDYPKGWCFNQDTHFDPFFHRQSSSITLLRQSCFCLAVDRAASAVFFSLRKPTWDMSLPFWSCLCLRLGNMKWNTLC